MFKKLIQATVAASLVATPMIAADAAAQRREVTTVKQRPNGTIVQKTTVRRGPAARPAQAQYRKWNRGQRFDRRQAQNYRVVDYRQYRGRQLYAPPRGHQWVRSGNDAVLVGSNTNVIAAVLANALR